VTPEKHAQRDALMQSLESLRMEIRKEQGTFEDAWSRVVRRIETVREGVRGAESADNPAGVPAVGSARPTARDQRASGAR
jgi:hypothetical protein